MVIETTTTKSQPVEDVTLAPPPPDPARSDMRSLLVRCKHCSHHYDSRHSDSIIRRNFRLGSKRAPLRSRCKSCNRISHIHSSTSDHVFAEVEARKLRQVADLIDTAEACNIHFALTGNCTRHEMYRIWRTQTRNTEGKAVPAPFKRWEQRGGN